VALAGGPTISEGQDKIEKGSSPTEAELSAATIHFREIIEALIVYVGLPAATLYPIGTAIYLTELFIFYGKNPLITSDFNSVAYAVVLLPNEYVMLQAFDVLTRGGFPLLAVLVPAILLSFLFYINCDDWKRFWGISGRRNDRRRLLIVIGVVVASLIVGYAYALWINSTLGNAGRFAAILISLLLAALLLTLLLMDTRKRQRSYNQRGSQDSSMLRSPLSVPIMMLLVVVVIPVVVIFAFAVYLVVWRHGNGDIAVGLGLIAVYIVFLGGVLSGVTMGKDYTHSRRIYAVKGTFIPRRRWILRGILIAYLTYSTTNVILAGVVSPPILPIAEIDGNDVVPILGTNSPYLLQNNTTYWFFLNTEGDIVALTNEQVGDVRVKW
jgi:hypothetical protein